MKRAEAYTSFLNAQGAFWAWIGGFFGPTFIVIGIVDEKIASHFSLGLMGIVINLVAIRTGIKAEHQGGVSDYIAYGLVSGLALAFGLLLCASYFFSSAKGT